MLKFKRLVSGLLAVSLAVGAVALPAVEGGVSFISEITASAGGNVGIYPSVSGDFIYNVLDDGTLAIEGYNGDDSTVTVPSEIDGVKVTTIWSFDYNNDENTSMTKLVISEGITDIGYDAFSQCSALTDITIPKSVVNIGWDAFKGTKWLENKKKENPMVIVNGILIDGTACTGAVTVPNTVTAIGDQAFYFTKITSVTLPNSITSIGSSAFCGTEIESINIPTSVTSIGYDAFFNTDWLTEKQAENPLVVVNNILIDGEKCTGKVTIPNTVKSIAPRAFADNEEITAVVLSDSVTEIGASAFESCSNLSSVTLSKKLKKIDGYAFSSCDKLTSIVIPDTVTSIGECAFVWCENLADITLPKNVTEIGNGAFADTKWLSAQKESGSYVVINGTLIESPVETGKETIPNNVSKIGDRLYWGCGITEVYIPETVTTIGELAFKRCTDLTKVTISEGVKTIESGAFYDCYSYFDSKGLTSITIPKSVTEIGCQAFGYMYDYETGYTGKVPNFKIYCYSGTAGETYAKENGIDYELLDESKPTTTATAAKPTATTTTTTKKATTITTKKVTATTTKKVTTTATKKTTTKKVTTTTAKKTTSKKSLKKAKATISKSSYAYTGKAIKPTVTVKYGSKKLTKGTDYTVSYKNNTKTGKATITIKGKGKYSGTITKTFNIVPKKATLSSVKSPKTKTLKVTWKKDSQATGYQIVYSTSSKFKSSKSVNISKNSTTSKTISKLTKGKTYYVKVRSYKTIGGKKVYGAYSTVKKIKCK